MNALIVLGFIAAILYGIFIDGTFFKIYFALIAIYTVIFQFIFINRSHFTKRKNITVATWGGKYNRIKLIISRLDNSSMKDKKRILL